MQEIERRLEQKEVIKSPEIWIPQFAVITISGPSGVGKTTIAGELAKKYRIPEERNIKAGQLLRKRTGEENAIGYIERPTLVDRELDQMQEKKITEATPHKPIIMEGRLSGFLAEQLLTKNKLRYPVIKLLLTANRRERFRRIWKRQDESESIKSLAEIAKLTHQREEIDRERWGKMYRELPGGDPFIPGAKDKKGHEIYDKIISTNDKSVAEVEAEIHNFLRDKGFVVKG